MSSLRGTGPSVTRSWPDWLACLGCPGHGCVSLVFKDRVPVTLAAKLVGGVSQPLAS